MVKRRILFCNYEFPPLGGGGSTACRCLARALVRRGHSVEVVTTRFRRQTPTVVAAGGRFRLTRIPALRRQKGQSNPIEMASFILSAGAHLLLRPRRNPDVIASFHSIPSGLAAMPATLLRRVPHMVLFRGGDVPGWLPEELEAMHRRTLPLNRAIVYTAQAALANSAGLQEMAQLAFPRAEVGLLQNGIDPREFRPPATPRQPTRETVRLLFAGRITTQKGVDVLLQALAQLDPSLPRWSVDVIGTGPELEAYRQLARVLRIDDRVAFRGWLEREELRRLYDDTDMLVFPSRYEGMPNVVLEAIGSGLPVVGTRIAGTEDLVEDGRNGYLVPVEDAAAVARAVAELLVDGEKRVRFGQESRRIALEKWSWEQRAIEFEAEMERVLIRGARGSTTRRR